MDSFTNIHLFANLYSRYDSREYIMPQNCAFLNCPHSRRYEGISLFRIPFPKSSDSEHTSLLKLEAREAWKTAILRTRQETSDLKERFVKHNIFLCEVHFEQDCIESFPFTDAHGDEKIRKRLQTGSVPTLNLPVKTLDSLPGSSTPQQRRTIVRHDAPSTSTASASRADKTPSFDDLKTYFKREYLYLHGWTVNVSDTNIIVEMREQGYLIPKYYIQIEETLEVTVSVYGATVPDTSALFPTGISRLLCKYKDLHDLLCGLEICCGISLISVEPEQRVSDETFLHVIPLVAAKQQSPVNYCQVRRSLKCEVLVEQGTNKCRPCCKIDEKMKKEANPVVHTTVYGPVTPVSPAKRKAPLSKCSSAKLQATVKDERLKLKEAELKCTQLEERIKRMEEEISSHGVRIDDEMSKSFLSILDQTNLKTTPHMRLVFEQQQKAMMTNKYSQRWHPHFIEFCLSIHAKSSSVYNELRKSEQNPDGILYLPHERTLRDYRNHFKPGSGFVLGNIELLKSIVKTYEGIMFILLVTY